MKRFLAMILALLLAVPLPAYAGATPSDADFDTTEFAVSRAVGPSFNNTVNYKFVNMRLIYTTTSGTSSVANIPITSDGYFSLQKPSNYRQPQHLEYNVSPEGRPSAGTYSMKFSLSPNAGVTWQASFNMYSIFLIPNSDPISQWKKYALPLTDQINTGHTITSYYEQDGVATQIINSGGDVFCEIGSLSVNNYKNTNFNIALLPTAINFPFGGRVKMSFLPINKNPSYSSVGKPPTTDQALGDIQQAVEQLPGKIEDVADAVQDVVQGIANLPQNIAGALEPHYDNILQQLHHITEQLHALWDQLAAYFNDKLIPQMITDTNRIVEAIEAINLEVNVDFDALKQQLAQQHKEQLDNDNKNTEEIVNGYENGDMDSISGQFGDAATNSDNAEDELINSVSGNISDFTFDSDIMFEYIEAIDDVAQIMSYFLELSIIKTPLVFMLTLSIALLMIGYYRFKGGG